MAIFYRILLIIGALFYCFSVSSEPHQSPFDKKLNVILASKDPALALKGLEVLLSDVNLTIIERINIREQQAKLFHQQNNLTSAIKILHLALGELNPFNLIPQQAVIQKLLGVMYYLKGDNSDALIAYNHALSFYIELNSQPLRQANLYNNIGLVHAATGRMEAAIKSYQQAQLLYQQFGSEVDQNDIKFNIAGLYNRLQRYDVAIKAIMEVIEARTKFNDQAGLALAYGDIGIAFLNSNQLIQAKLYFLKSLTYYQDVNDTYFIASQLGNLADVYSLIERRQLSIEYAKQCVEFATVSDNQYAFVGCHYMLAKEFFALQHYEQSLKHIRISQNKAREINAIAKLNQGYNLLALVLAAQGEILAAVQANDQFTKALMLEKSNELTKHLNEYYALLESEQLRKEVQDLTQSKKVDLLQRNFMIIAVILILVSVFLFYRRLVDRSIKTNLTKQVDLRTAQLEQTMSDLQRATEIKSQFLANMSHEIRTPLSAIIGQAEAILAGHVDADYLEYEVNIVLNNSNHLLDLVNDILDLSQIEANKLTLNVDKSDLHDILDTLVDLFTKQAFEKGLNFSICHDLPQPLWIEVDYVRLKQILINLCSNAIKFTYHGDVKVNVFIDRKLLKFQVKDSGIGLSNEQREQIFYSFSQGDSSISRRFGGSGLCLCLSQQLATLMGGYIGVDSEIEQGSTFTLVIPYLDDTPEDLCDNRVGSLSYPIDFNDTQLTGLILLADDHHDNRRLFERFLRVLGLDVVCAVNGFEVVDICQKQRPDLILLDIQMPEMDGLEAYKIVREQGFSNPIVALTANAMTHEIAAYEKLGFDGYLSKPMDRSQFVTTIARLLKQHITEKCGEQQLNKVELNDLSADFKASLGSELIKLGRLIETNDYQALAITAHKLSGAASMFGFPEMAKLTAEIENSINSDQFTLVDQLLGALLEMLKLENN